MSSLATFVSTTDLEGFTFDTQRGLYRDALGKAVPWAAVREAVDMLIAGAQVEAGLLAETLRREHGRDPQGAIKRFGEAMLLLVLALHRAAAYAALSGVPDLLVVARAQLVDVGAREGLYMAGFLGTLYAMGTDLVPVAQIAARAGSYMDAALITFERGRYTLHTFLDFAEGRRVLNPQAEHCRGCDEQAAFGWVPIAEVKPLGFEDCAQWCKCDLEYRRGSIHAS